MTHQILGVFGILGAQHPMAGVLQVERNQLLYRGFVFNHQNIGRHREMGIQLLACDNSTKHT